MDYRRFGNKLVLRVDRGEEVMAKLREVCEKEEIRLALITGLGAADLVEIGEYDVDEKKMHRLTLEEKLEITSLVGSVTEMNGKPYLHLHITLSDDAGKVYGGHLISVRIIGTSEIFLDIIDGSVGRRSDWFSDTGLNLFDFH